ncbi:MAG: tripartite tricarboxylate transporter substrate binding protein [Bradyrhizobium sp.]|uniref:Bug family tripartite tricarboxylate transporter substrate binding protein n=1 Tax=Bradyrhizobium sp. TaxID=376 RepID=UPI0025C5EB18|nr:tripartite tricarboxylate transporter substrate binding protein [Bradyrhizobium sp.]MBI5260739.1 tripartite tricarboxylate transporter substrate binding protein [Bradyrhizobium sp.]
MKLQHSLVLVFATLIIAVTPGRTAQALDYPARTVRIVVGFGPGTAPDIVARLLGDQFFQAWGKPVVIENTVGANGNIAGERVARTKPDGHTLLLAAAPGIVINPSLYEKMPFDPVRELVPISQVCAYGNILIVSNDVPAKNVQELVALARARPGALTYASAGFGSTLHLAGELLKSMAKVDILHVPYGGTAFGQEVVAGRISMAFVPPTGALPLARDGKVKALAMTSLKRHAGAPDLPTMAESGFPDFDLTVWFGLLAPARTPPAIVDKLYRETARILAIPDIRKRFGDLGIEPIGNSPAEFAAVIDDEIPKWAKLIREAGIKLHD